MHELSIAATLVESVLEFAEAHGGPRIVTVRITIGELTCIEADQLSFCYESVTQETALEGSKLEIEVMPALVRCAHCDYEGRPKYWDDALAGSPVATLQCPKCGKAAEATQGHECAIKSVQYVQ
jgi:hydrogenase nickel incorporation protein HypA/HybF